jgi:translation initiation factor IF-2
MHWSKLSTEACRWCDPYRGWRITGDVSLLGFNAAPRLNVRPEPAANLASRRGRHPSVQHHLLRWQISAPMEGLLARPCAKYLGRVKCGPCHPPVRTMPAAIFWTASSARLQVRLVRDNVVVWQGKMSSSSTSG